MDKIVFVIKRKFVPTLLGKKNSHRILQVDYKRFYKKKQVANLKTTSSQLQLQILYKCNPSPPSPSVIRFIQKKKNQSLKKNVKYQKNILYGVDNPESISVEMLENAAKEANAHDFILNFPEGIKMLIRKRFE